MKVITIVAVFVALIAVTNAAEKVIMCYYQPVSFLAVNQLKNADKCTHMIYSSIGTAGNGEFKVDDVSLHEFSTLKQLNPNMKSMVTVNVKWIVNPYNDSYSDMHPFIQNVKNLLEKYNLDGVDLEWASPDSNDKTNFIKLIRDLKATLVKSNKILTAKVYPYKALLGTSYNIKEMNRYLDYINIMTYKRFNMESDFITPLNEVKESIKGWLQGGAESGKLVLGITVFGKSNVVGDLAYNEICKKIKSEGYIRKFNEQNKVLFIEKGNENIDYEDKESLKLKTDLVNELNLGGVMVWVIHQDDTKNECGDGKFPLLNALSEGLNR